jgi:hypothetical protein
MGMIGQLYRDQKEGSAEKLLARLGAGCDLRCCRLLKYLFKASMLAS